MGNRIETCKKAYALVRSESRRDTVIAVGLLAVVFGPFLYRLYWDNRSNIGFGSQEEPEVV